MIKTLKLFFADESGASAIEYGILAAGIGIAIYAGVTTLGTELNTTFSSIGTSISN